MNGLHFVVFALLLAVGLTSPAWPGYHYLYRNDYRQHAVNAKAVANHAGIGTAATYGVPGSASGIHGHKSGYHNYGHDHKSGYNHKSGYGYPGYLHHPVYFYGR